MTSKLSKYFVSAILLVAVFGFIFVMGQYGIHQSVDKHLLEVNNELGINMFPTIDQTIEAEAASNNGGSNGTVSSFSLNAGSGSYYYTGSIASLSCSDSDSQDSKWNRPNTSCSSYAESTKTITFTNDMEDAIASGRLYGILKFTVTVSLSGNSGTSSYYNVSGGLTKGNTSMGTGTHTIGTSGTKITSKVITIKIWGSAASSDGWYHGSSSSVSLSTSAVWLDLYFDDLPVSYSAGSNGSVSSSGSTLATPSASTSSTATPNSGYYFSGWTGTFSHPNKSITIKACDYNNASIGLTANFASIPVSVGTYIYNGSAQGPTASGVTGYSYTYNYNGNAND
ncbi:MAG: hypothetical protein PHI19_00385, partial [Clostridia bacterium]|nr:hypothetical protein [Clostridia bacterium]